MKERMPRVGDTMVLKSFEELIKTKGLEDVNKDTWAKALDPYKGKVLKVHKTGKDCCHHDVREYVVVWFTHGEDRLDPKCSDFFKILS